MPSRSLTAALAACLFVLIVSAKWTVFDRYGSPMPDWDQWDAEGSELFAPWFEHDHFLQHLLHPHNEHRVVMTKLQNLTLGVLNGQWDARLEAATNAVLHGAIATVLWLFSRRRLARIWHAPLFLITFALFGLPFAWQNLLGGFHSQQYWLLGLSLIAIVTLPYLTPRSRAWWLGAAAAALALLSMGSGLLAATVVFMLAAWRWVRGETTLRAAWPTLAVGVTVTIIGALTRVDAPGHAHMKAKNIHDFALSMLHSMQWPWRDHNELAFVLWLPWGLVVARVLAWRNADPARADLRQAGQTIAAIGGWVIVQIAATAYARGADANYPASRYMDTLAIGALANALALGWLHTIAGSSRQVRILQGLAGVAWLAAFGLGFHPLIRDAFRYELPGAKKYYVKAEANMRRYLATRDPRHLAHQDIPYPSAESLIDRLERPSIRNLMPAPLRTPQEVTARPAGAGTVFLENDARQAGSASPPHRGLSPATLPLDYTRSWGSFASDGGARAEGEWRSEPIPPPRRRGWLRFEVAGHLGEPGVGLELRAASDDTLLGRVQPNRVPGDVWRFAHVRAPDRPYVLVARDHDPQRWIAFSGPIEMGPLSYWAYQANRHAWLVLLLGSAATILLAGVSLLRRRRPTSVSPGRAEGATAARTASRSR